MTPDRLMLQIEKLHRLFRVASDHPDFEGKASKFALETFDLGLGFAELGIKVEARMNLHDAIDHLEDLVGPCAEIDQMRLIVGELMEAK